MSKAAQLKQNSAPEHPLRKSNRLDLRASDGVSVHFPAFSAQAYDISPFGFGIIADTEKSSWLVVGSEHECNVSYPPSNNVDVSVTVCWREPAKPGHTRIGFRYSEVAKPIDSTGQLQISESSPISGYFYSSGTYYERASFTLQSFNLHEGVMRIFDSAMMLVPGMKVDLHLHQWDSSGHKIKAEVVSSHLSEKNNAFIQIKILDFPEGLREKIANFIFSFSDVSYSQLKAAGLLVATVAEHLRFRYIKTESEYSEVLKLRFKAYKAAGKVPEGKTYRDMAAPLDHISRILAAYHGEKLVASVSMTYPDSEDTILDTERPFGTKYPKPIPEKKNILEVSRLCTDHEYRGSDLLVRMFEYLYKGMHCGNREYTITSADDNLLPLYQSIGFRKTGMSYDHPYLAGIRHHVIMVHRDVGDSYKGFNPIAWAFLYSRMNFFLQSSGSIKKSFVGSLRLKLASAIGIIFFRLRKFSPRKAARRFQKR